eukprot:SM000158S02038  [mRNA]  locus=s158:244588:246433:- [translate_table: standard]
MVMGSPPPPRPAAAADGGAEAAVWPGDAPAALRYEELAAATRGFKAGLAKAAWRESVYRGALARPGGAVPLVVEKYADDVAVGGQREWLEHVEFLARLRHPNLVRLLGYCADEPHRLLVFPYHAHGSLDMHLSSLEGLQLDWEARVRILGGTASALAYLHCTAADAPIAYCDLLPANILLDNDCTAYLSLSGLARGHRVYKVVQGSRWACCPPGMALNPHCAPEAEETGGRGTSAAADIYAFGVVVLEVLAGRHAFEPDRWEQERNLLPWVTAKLAASDSGELHQVVDSRLQGKYSASGARVLIDLAFRCMAANEADRPAIHYVTETLQALQGRSDYHCSLPPLKAAICHSKGGSEDDDGLRRGCEDGGVSTASAGGAAASVKTRLPLACRRLGDPGSVSSLPGRLCSRVTMARQRALWRAAGTAEPLATARHQPVTQPVALLDESVASAGSLCDSMAQSLAR